MGGAWRYIAVAWLLASPLAAAGATFYVDPAGNDGYPGSAQMPWRTIQHAAASLSPGDTAIVHPGIYTEQVFITGSGTAAAPITFQADAGAVLESPNPAASLSAFDVMPGVAHVVIDGFEARGNFHETIYLRDDAHHIVVRNCDIHSNRVGVWLAGANDVEIDGCHLHDNTVVGLRVDGDSRNVVVRDTVSDDNDDGLGCSGDADGFVVEETATDVAFLDCSATGNSEDGFDLQGDRILVARSRSQGNGCVGIKTGRNVRIENSVVTGNVAGVASTALYDEGIRVDVINSIVADNANTQIRFAQPDVVPPIVYEAVARNLVVRGSGKAIEAEPHVILTEDHNILFRNNDTVSRVLVHHIGATERFYTGQQINAGVWTAESGQGVGTLAVDPDFVPGPEYFLSAQSTAIDCGTDNQAPADDIDGFLRPQGNAIDSGPYESTNPLDNHRPWADPGPNRWGVAGFALNFSAYGSVDLDGDPLAFSWNFGDASTPGAGSNVSHTWAQPGDYWLTLTASDGALERSRSALVSISAVNAPTSTPTATPTSTPTRTSTSTPTSTPTRTSTSTPTSTPTRTSTSTPTSTPTRTSTATPTPTPTRTSTSTPTRSPTWTATRTPNLTRDSVLLPVRPLKVKIQGGDAMAFKALRVKVYNADPSVAGDPGHVVRLAATIVDCASGVVAAVDLDSGLPGSQETMLIAPGRGVSAAVGLTLPASSFTMLNVKSPQRCVVRLTASTELAGNVDPTPSNNEVLVAIDVYDGNDMPQATSNETVIDASKPQVVAISTGAAAAVKKVSFRVSNGDIIPQRAVPGHTITVSASDGDCPPGTISNLDLDAVTPGAQNSVTLEGGRRVTGTLTVTTAASAFTSPSRRSPARCVAQLTASGPTVDADESNDAALLSIDVTDLNDQ